MVAACINYSKIPNIGNPDDLAVELRYIIM